MSKSDKPVEVTGGTVTKEVEVTPVEQVEETGPMMEVITTDPGTLSDKGIVPVGTKASIPVGKYSATWMKPANAKEAKKLIE